MQGWTSLKEKRVGNKCYNTCNQTAQIILAYQMLTICTFVCMGGAPNGMQNKYVHRTLTGNFLLLGNRQRPWVS